MEVLQRVILLCFLTVLPCYVQSTVICGDSICHGSGAYCCVLDSGEEGCCWSSLITPIYGFWWFWTLWIAVICFILACSLSYLRRRRRLQRMAVMANSQYPTYGTVVRTQSSTRNIRPVAAPGNLPQAQIPPQPPYPQGPPSYAAIAPMAPPSYMDSEAAKNDKPPAYSA